MTYTIDIPNIQTLDPKDPSYVTKLDAGVETLRASANVLYSKLESFKPQTQVVLDYLKANGLSDVTHEILLDQREKTPDSELAEIQILFSVPRTEKQKARQLEDVLDSFDKKLEDEFNYWLTQRKNLIRSAEDYTEAIGNLTQVQAIGTTNPVYNDVHLFLIRPDGVYDVHLKVREQNKLQVQKSENLTPQLFDDPKYIEDFTKQSEGVMANAYVVRNPSVSIPAYELGRLAAIQVLTEMINQAKEQMKKADEQKSPGLKLVDRIKKAMGLKE